MRLVLRASKIRLLQHADAGYVALNSNGNVILQLPDRKPRYVTTQIDELEFFRLVQLAGDSTFRPTELGRQKIREYLQGGDNDKDSDHDRSVSDAAGETATP